MNKISTEFCLATLLLVSIFLINACHILYLVLVKPNSRLKPVRFILLNFSLSCLIVSIWLIPFFYFRLLWSAESWIWRLWCYMFHITDAVQIYSLLLFLIIPSRQAPYICFIWLVPIIAYSPLLWLTALPNSLDYLPYRLLTNNTPWWMLATLYLTMYFMPLFTGLLCSCLRVICSRKSPPSHPNNCPSIESSFSEHDQDMAELTTLVETVLNFHLTDSSNKKRKKRKRKFTKKCHPVTVRIAVFTWTIIVFLVSPSFDFVSIF